MNPFLRRAAEQLLDDENEEQPAPHDEAIVESGKWFRASGDCTCETCQAPYYDHPRVRGYRWLYRLCNQDLVKL